MIDRSKHILVVEDDDDVREMIFEVLKEYAYRVSTASGGSMMRDFLAIHDAVDCVILDARMPGEASASLALYLKECGIPVVMISGDPEAMKYAYENGHQLLQKPFRPQELYSAVNEAIAADECGQRSKGGR